MLLYTARVLAAAAQGLRLALPAPFASVTAHFRVMPWHCDQNLHLNNGQYLLFMDLGRTAWLAASGMATTAIRERWTLLAAGISITYRRPIDHGQRFTVETRLVTVTDRWMYLEQVFRRADGSISARALFRGAVRIGGKPLHGIELLRRAGFAVEELPPVPQEFLHWEAGTHETMAWIRENDGGGR